MNAPRSKNVTVGGREFVVRPLIWRVAEEVRAMGSEGMKANTCDIVARILQRMAPDVTSEWLANNGDTAEFADVIQALTEVSGGTDAKGEAPAP